MKLVTFTYNNKMKIGAVVDDQIVDASQARNLPTDMISFLTAGSTAIESLQNLIDTNSDRIPLADVHLEAPIQNPQKFLAIGLNYGKHIAETGMDKPEFPTFFNKQSSCVNGPFDPIHLPKVSEKLDYEGELAFVIGKKCRHVPKEKAHEVIAGFTIVNDVSVRDWQFRAQTMTLGKSFDTHGPVGPWIVTSDEISDPHNLNINVWVDEEQRQEINTNEMIFDCYDMIKTLSTAFTLMPGDIISTGTGAGVGVKMKPRGYMKAGQVCRIEIESIGTIENPVIDEPDDTVMY
ncbi:MAG: fumarylacetoacetate hydrolase family protein [Gammaproteobacteria bacterium]